MGDGNAHDRDPADRPAWIDTVPREKADGLLADIYAGIAGRSGSVAHILLCQSLHPEALRDHYALYRNLMFGRGALSRVERESIGVAVSAVNGCRY
ncbi:MAG: carboxymuconolactone decarboxylase family protein [Gemmatimonadota bacterium]